MQRTQTHLTTKHANTQSKIFTTLHTHHAPQPASSAHLRHVTHWRHLPLPSRPPYVVRRSLSTPSSLSLQRRRCWQRCRRFWCFALPTSHTTILWLFSCCPTALKFGRSFANLVLVLSRECNGKPTTTKSQLPLSCARRALPRVKVSVCALVLLLATTNTALVVNYTARKDNKRATKEGNKLWKIEIENEK